MVVTQTRGTFYPQVGQASGTQDTESTQGPPPPAFPTPFPTPPPTPVAAPVVAPVVAAPLMI